jgi:transposase-like protein
MKNSIVRLPIEKLKLDGGTQPRAVMDFEAINDYSEDMEAGVKFPPVIVFYDGENYWLADGFHRVKAAFGAGFDEIECEVHQGTLEDAQWYSFGANKTNGLRRTNADKQRAVQAALKHPRGVGLSDSQIAKHVGVSQRTVSNWRSQLEASQKISKIATRTVTRKGKTYQQRTDNIGKRTRPKPELKPVQEMVQEPVQEQATAPEPDTNLLLEEHVQPDNGFNKWDSVFQAVATIADCDAASADIAREVNSRRNREQIIVDIRRAHELLASLVEQIDGGRDAEG